MACCDNREEIRQRGMTASGIAVVTYCLTCGDNQPSVVICDDCDDPTNRDGAEPYCYNCDPTFGEK